MHQTAQPNTRQRVSLDGFLPSAQKQSAPRQAAISPAPSPRQPAQIPRRHPSPRVLPKPLAKATKEKRWKTRLKDVATIAIALALGFVVQSVLLGQVVLIIYALCVFVFRIDSRTTYLLAIMSLGVVLIASARSDQRLASLFGVYSFILLAIGTISLGREVRNEW